MEKELKNEITFDEFIESLIEYRNENNCGSLKVILDGYYQSPSGIVIVDEYKRTDGTISFPKSVYIF